MSKRVILGAALAAILSIPTAALAQEQEGGMPEAQLWSVTTWELNPADAMVFQGLAEKVVKAAGQASLAKEYGWTFWNNLYTYTIVGLFDAAELKDPEVWMKRFKGTPGEATLMEAFQEMQSVGVRNVRSELVQDVPGWMYMPEGMAEGEAPSAYIHVHEFWLKSGVEQQFDALVKDYMTFFKDVGYKYPIHGHRVRYGDVGRTVFVTMYDSPGDYYGANSLEYLIEQHNATDRWEELGGRLAQLTTAAEESHVEFVASMSYMGPEQQAAR